MIWRTTLIATALAVPFATPTMAQREWAATVERAIGRLADDHRAIETLREILAGRLHSPTDTERDALADRLADMILADTTRAGWEVRFGARSALREAAADHPHSFDALVRAHEAAEALGFPRHVGLLTIYMADEEGRGRDYVTRVFETSEPPDCQRGGWLIDPDDPRPPCTSSPHETAFCRAGRALYHETVEKLRGDRAGHQCEDCGKEFYAVEGLEGNAAKWWDHCWG